MAKPAKSKSDKMDVQCTICKNAIKIDEIVNRYVWDGSYLILLKDH